MYSLGINYMLGSNWSGIKKNSAEGLVNMLKHFSMREEILKSVFVEEPQ